MTRPISGCRCRYCRGHGREKRFAEKAMRRLTKKALRDGTETPKTVSYGYGGFGVDADVRKHDSYLL